MTKRVKCQFKRGDRVVAKGKDSANRYTGTFLGKQTESEWAEDDPSVRVRKDGSVGASANWQCRLKKDGRVASAYGLWDKKTYLKKLTPEQVAIEKMQR